MDIILNRKAKVGFLKTVSVLTAIATILSLSGLLYFFTNYAGAVAPADYGLKEGNTISAAGSDDPDVYIVNEMGYKRLFLNPVIFGFYGHLGGFAAVKSVSPSTRDAFMTSGLFRNCETGDEKVYGVQTTGEDVGSLRWVNTSGAQAVTDDPNFFKKVFCINSNEFNWYPKGAEFTSVNQVPVYTRTTGATPTPAVGPLSVSLAPGNPAAQTITKNAQAIEFLRVRFSGSGTINSMTFKRGGPGATADFDNVFLYDGATRLTSGKSLTASDGLVTFVNLSIKVDGSKELSAVADMNATASNIDTLSLTAVEASGTVSNLPLAGNNMTIAGATSGGVTVAKVGSLGNPNVGSKNAQLSEFKLTSNTEAASVKKITMLQGGTLKPADLSNIKLVSGTTEWVGKEVTKAGHLVFDLGTGFTIVKGGNAIFKVYGDVNGKVDETVKLYFEELVDIQAVGDQYGYTMAITNTVMDVVGEAHALTLQGGTLTITFNGPNASNIGTDTSDTVLMKYSMTAVSNIEVRKTRWTLCQNHAGSGNYDNAAATTDGWYDLEDFKVMDEGSGATVMGPLGGSSFTTSASNSCPNAATGAQKQFTDVFDLSAGKTRNFKVTADIKTANTNGTTDSGTAVALTADDKIKVILEDYTADTPDLSIMKYPDTNTSVADADIVPGADVSSNEFTIQASTLTIGLAGTPGSQTFVKGTKTVDVVGITFAANQASALKVSDITLTGYASDNTTTFDEGTDVTDTSVSVANAMTNFRLVEAESGAIIADNNKVTTNNLNVQNTGTIKFSFAGSPWTLAAGATKTLLVRVDLSTNAASGTAGDGYSFDIAATANVTATDDASNSINAGNQVVNGTTSPTKKLTVKGGGTMTLATHADSPTLGAMYWGQIDAPVSKFSLSATDEAFFVEKFTVAASVTAEATDASANVKQVKLTYKNKDGSTLTTVQSFTNGASANFGWNYGGSGTDTRPYVPKDGSLAIDAAASLRTKAEGATQVLGSAQAVFFSLDLVDSYDASTANGFKAIGEGSGTVLDGASADIKWVAGSSNQYVYRVFPKIEQVALVAPYSLTGTPTVFKFSVTAMGLTDAKLRFDNESLASGSIFFEVVASGEFTDGSTSTTYTIYDESNVIIDASSHIRCSRILPPASPYTSTCNTANEAWGALPSVNASIVFDFTSKDVEIAGGGTKTFRIQLDNPNTNYSKTSSTGRAADYFQVTLLDDFDGIINWVADYNNATSAHDQESIKNTLRSLPLYGPTFQR